MDDVAEEGRNVSIAPVRVIKLNQVRAGDQQGKLTRPRDWQGPSWLPPIPRAKETSKQEHAPPP